MITVRAKAECASCGTEEEYWATLDVDSVDESDTFTRRERPVISISLPGGWGRTSYSSNCTCGPCIEKLPRSQQDRFRRY
jgi:hypothetical protein